MALNSYIEKQVVGHGVGERFQYGWSGGWGVMREQWKDKK